MNTSPSKRPSGFTLIELLTVIAIIGILAAIIIPTTGAVRVAAKKADTKSRFGQWAQAMSLYKQEYGFFPPINRDAYGTARENSIDPETFAIALTGRELDGDAMPATATVAQMFGNKKRLSFYSMSDSDLNTARTAVVDAFGNTDIAVIYDLNADGRITNDDRDGGNAVPTVRGDGSGYTTELTATTGMSATDGPRASVIFYSAGKGENASDIVYSWK